MSIRQRVGRGFALARDSIDVLRDYPRLLWFPFCAGVAGIAFFALVLGASLGLLPFAVTADLPEATAYGGLAVGILGSTFLSVVFTAGLMFAARDAMYGQEPSVWGGLRAAWSHRGTLFAWALVSAVVGVAVRALQESDNLAGIVAGVLFSMSWAVITYFVVPVAVFEDEGITGVFGRSIDIVRDTWGESLGAEFGLGFVSFFAFAGVAVVGAFVGVITGNVGAVVAVVVPLGVLAFVVVSTLNGIAKVALYEYATTNEPPRYFENVDFDVGGGDRVQPTRGIRGGV